MLHHPVGTLGEPLVTVRGAVVIVIGIQRNALGKPMRLTTRTASHLSPLVGYTPPHLRPVHHVAREALWVTVDLLHDERLLIHAKPSSFGFFAAQDYELDAHHSNVATGPVLHVPTAPLPPPGPGSAIDPPEGTIATRMVGAAKLKVIGEWRYGLTLFSPRLGHTPLPLDPVIIIVEDP